MPSPRAVLADIKKFRLDPSKAHSNIRANGHLGLIQDQIIERPLVVEPMNITFVENVVVDDSSTPTPVEISSCDMQVEVFEQVTEHVENVEKSISSEVVDELIHEEIIVEQTSEITEEYVPFKKSKKKKIN
jgi:hypothetical protein